MWTHVLKHLLILSFCPTQSPPKKTLAPSLSPPFSPPYSHRSPPPSSTRRRNPSVAAFLLPCHAAAAYSVLFRIS
ncbi:hypothetical protein HanRHA438_Chr09g0404801 [Helianthus annuus]|uniref:Uncharacterized protein n=1 Tax=Helianthus annuus TaxID=4232 RepID=A0A251TWF8_HELAN|nr:hypothetical protein HanXRQr2_Chr09g0392991 [Helianthus annuus]KAJ0534814.1 hypothetical protein HanIR_Chr09g0423881 [Helianthus annuus]KAJ0888693.1 hypothetical protein HanRHA438_Chr09g0404801 [Helianthus annuus]KAJ0893553.1 hypothetical protein HanPSC8_Chr09g0378931 [Helianthus annuus]